MLRPDNLFQIFGIILLLLASIGFISFTSKLIFGLGKMKGVRVTRHVFDADQACNVTWVCPFAANAHQARYNRTTCSNKTMQYWYIPWVHFDVWRNFRRANEGKTRRRLEELEVMRRREAERRERETKAENPTEDAAETGPAGTAADQASSSRKVSDEPSNVACTILAALLILSSLVAFCEVFRDKCVAKAKAAAKASEEKRSSSDATLSDLLTQTSDAMQSRAKVTQTLVHQSSLDRAISRLSSEVKPPFLRRGSVPAHFLGGCASAASNDSNPCYVQSRIIAGNQDHSPLNQSPDTKRKSRHFIRRH